MKESKRIEPGPGQESVWDYPRPPKLEPASRRVRVVFNGRTIADSTRAYRVLETSHPPVYYIPLSDVDPNCLKPATGPSTGCEWKGRATYFDVEVDGQSAQRAAWQYPEPSARFAPIYECVAFYPAAMEACFLDQERVQAQPGDFYGGWITQDIVGPFKGAAGTWGW